MSILTNLLSGGAAKLVSSVGGVIDNLHTSKEEKLEAEEKIKDLDQKLVLMHNGWEVFDFWYNEMPELWNQKKYTENDAKNSIIRIVKW